MLCGIYGNLTDLYPGMVGLEDCESLSARLKKTKVIPEKSSSRHFLATQQAIEIQELDNAYWIPGRENPADALTELKSALLPILRLAESGTRNPGYLRPLQGLAFRDP